MVGACKRIFFVKGVASHLLVHAPAIAHFTCARAAPMYISLRGGVVSPIIITGGAHLLGGRHTHTHPNRWLPIDAPKFTLVWSAARALYKGAIDQTIAEPSTTECRRARRAPLSFAPIVASCGGYIHYGPRAWSPHKSPILSILGDPRTMCTFTVLAAYEQTQTSINIATTTTHRSSAIASRMSRAGRAQ